MYQYPTISRYSKGGLSNGDRDHLSINLKPLDDTDGSYLREREHASMMRDGERAGRERAHEPERAKARERGNFLEDMIRILVGMGNKCHRDRNKTGRGEEEEWRPGCNMMLHACIMMMLHAFMLQAAT